MSDSHDVLFDLIHKLNKKEARKFLYELKKTKPNKKSHHQRIFQAIYSMETYDKTLLKKRVKGIKPNVFTVEKSTLKESLLDYMVHQRKSGHYKLHKGLDHIEILIEQQLYEEAYTYCKRIKKEAKRHGYLYLVIETNYREGAILQHLDQGAFKPTSEKLTEDSIKIADHMKLTLLAGQYYYQVAALVHDELDVRKSKFINSIADLKNNQLFKLDANDKTYPFYLKCYLAMAKGCLYKLTGEMEEAYLQEKIVWDQLRADWKFYLTHKRGEVLSSVINYTDALCMAGRQQAFREHMEFAEILLTKEFNCHPYLQSVLMLYRLIDLVTTQDRILTKEEIKPFTTFYDSKVIDQFIAEKKEYAFFLGRAFFNMDEFKLANEYLSAINNDYKRTDIRSDMNEYALFMRLIITVTQEFSLSFEQSKVNIEISVEPYYHHIRRKTNDDYRIEDAFIDFFNKIKSGSTRNFIVKETVNLEQQLHVLLNETNAYVKFMGFYFDFRFILNKWREYLGKKGDVLLNRV